ncbi:MAG: hypothetical protein RB148_07335 [Armatimonadota bacterium]|nr:hypothetical protein [Armatimonadota bacterium]
MDGRPPRWLIAASVLLVGGAAGLLLSLQPAPVLIAQRATVPARHENPTTAAEEAEAPAVFEWYLASLTRFRARRFAEGRRIVVRLRDAHLPPEIASLVGDINILLIKEGSILEASEEWLRAAAGLIASARLGVAGPLLAQVERYTRRGAVLVDDLIGEFQDLGRRSRVEALPPEAAARKAYEAVLRLLPEPKAMLAQYQRAALEARRLTASDVRAIAMAVRAAAVAAGLLPQPGVGLPPQPAPGLLPPELAEVITYPTHIRLDAFSPAYPGRRFSVRITVTEEAPVPSRRSVLLLLDDRPLAAFSLGSTTHQLLLPPRTAPGVHRLSATVPRQGPYLAAAAQSSLRVIQAASNVRLVLPRVTLAPGRLHVSGRATSRFGPLANALVEVRTGPAAGVARTSPAGEFTLTLRLPAALDFVGPEAVTARTFPEEPWNAAGDGRASIFVVNLINATLAGLMALALPLAGLTYRRTQRTAQEPLPAPVIPVKLPGLLRAPAPISDTVVQRQPRTAREEIIAAYLEALAAVRRQTGVEPLPAMTVREYAARVRPRLPTEAFARLTGMVEVAFYSARVLEPETPALARDLSGQVRREVGRALR